MKKRVVASKTVLLREVILASRKKQEAQRSINVRTRVIQDKTNYTRRAKHSKKTAD